MAKRTNAAAMQQWRSKSRAMERDAIASLTDDEIAERITQLKAVMAQAA